MSLARRPTVPSSSSGSSSPSSTNSSGSSSSANNDTTPTTNPLPPVPTMVSKNRNNFNINTTNNKTTGLFSPRGRSVLCMSLSLAIHLGGYELSRATVMALFTSDSLGFGHGNDGGGLSTLPMAVGCVSPFSVALLWFYAATLDRGGPSYALRTHTLICAGVQIVSGWILKAFDSYLEMEENGGGVVVGVEMMVDSWPFSRVKAWSRLLLFALFVFQNSYVQLLYNQHWAFISSVLTPEEGGRVFAPIAGLGSIGSTLAAGMVSVFVARIGLIGLLHVSGASYIVSAILADVAFGIARVGGFEPRGVSTKYGGLTSAEPKRNDEITTTTTTTSSSFGNKGAYAPMNGTKETTSTTTSSSPKTTTCVPCTQKGNVFQQARALFRRFPVLGALFLETIASQCLSSLVNFIYLYTLKATITDDAMRAGWSGNFYAWINGVSGVFQFFAIPVLLKHVEAHRIWLFMPALMLCCTLFTFATFRSSGLFSASASFFAIKTMEYSLRVAANETLYVSLDYESRYLGKKVISLIAGKFGKSAMAIALSVVMVLYGDKPDTMWYLMATATFFTFLWLYWSMRLHSLIELNK